MADIREIVEDALERMDLRLAVPWDAIESERSAGEQADDPQVSAETVLEACRQVAVAVPEADERTTEVLVHTVFAAKGQQWDHVFLAGSFGQSFLDTEVLGHGLRLLYVAITRSCKSLAITVPRNLRYTSLGYVIGQVGSYPVQLSEALAEADIAVERDPN